MFELLAVVENDPTACATIRENIKLGNFRGQPLVYEHDIRNLEPKELATALDLQSGELDVLIGGPPCQAFSTAGRRQSVEDPRGTLLWRFMDYIVDLMPKVFVMENVRGLMSASLRHRVIAERPENGGKPLDDDELPGSVIQRLLHDLNTATKGAYRIQAFEVNSVNYGAPQIRERVIFIGNRIEQTAHFPEPTHQSPVTNSYRTQEPNLFDTAYQKPDWHTLYDAIGDIHEKNPELMNFSPRKLEYLRHVPEGGNWRSLPVHLQQESMGKAWHAKGGRSGWWRRLSWHLPSPTLITMPNHASTSLCHPSELRALSVREYARIQEFPENWTFCGKTTDKYRQIGNAVPVRLGCVTAEVTLKMLTATAKNRLDSVFSTQYINSHVRTRQWFKNGKAVLD